MKSLILLLLVSSANLVLAQTNSPAPAQLAGPVKLADVRLRDCCVWTDTNSQTYYLVSSTGRRGPNGRPAVVEFTSKDLETWDGPRVIFEVPENFWAHRGIWAPELHDYRGKFYLFLTFNTDDLLPEQWWRNWEPRVETRFANPRERLPARAVSTVRQSFHATHGHDDARRHFLGGGRRAVHGLLA